MSIQMDDLHMTRRSKAMFQIDGHNHKVQRVRALIVALVLMLPGIGVLAAIPSSMPAVAYSPMGADAQKGQVSSAPSGSTDIAEEQAISSGRLMDEPGFVWTPEEMAKAKPIEMHAQLSEAGGAPQPRSNGPELSIPSMMPTDAITPDNIQPEAYTTWPLMAVGKVFFRDGGLSYVCSGSSAVNRAIWTAGHCVYNNTAHRCHTNFAFVPAYDTGSQPYGLWTSSDLWSLNGWTAGGANASAYDIGMAVMNNLNGYTLSQRVGHLGMLANGSRTQLVVALGYPQAAPYNGNSMFGCYSQYRGTDPVFNPATNWIDCDLTGGSSGGPWVIDFRSGGLLYVNSVNSYRYTNNPRRMYGPYFGTGAINLYNAVRYR